jgi:hypothetical protein
MVGHRQVRARECFHSLYHASPQAVNPVEQVGSRKCRLVVPQLNFARLLGLWSGSGLRLD